MAECQERPRVGWPPSGKADRRQAPPPGGLDTLGVPSVCGHLGYIVDCISSTKRQNANNYH